MKQRSFGFPKPKPTIRQQRKGFDVGNAEAARIILADPLHYEPDSGLAQWATAVIRRIEKERQDRV